MEDKKELMLSLAQTYRNEQIKTNADEKYGDGTAQFFMQAIETLILKEQPDTPIGKYGRMRLRYLKEHRKVMDTQTDSHVLVKSEGLW